MIKTKNNTDEFLKILAKAVIISGAIGYFTIAKPLIKRVENDQKKLKKEQSIHPTVLNYEGKDSVRIERTRIWPDRREFMYINQANDLHNPQSDYERTTLIAKNGKVVSIGIETHMFIVKKYQHRPSGQSRGSSSYYELSGGYNTSWPAISSSEYQRKYEYYTHKLDSLENVFKK